MPQSRHWLEVTLASVGDAVLATDTEARVVFLNPVAERLTGWPQQEAQGRPIGEVFVIVNETTRLPAENPALRALAEGCIQGLANHTVLIARDGTERGIDDTASPIRDASGAILGAVLVFRDVSAERRNQRRRAARLAVTQILAQGPGVRAPEHAVIEALGRELRWDAVTLWLADGAGQLRRREAWVAPPGRLEGFVELEGARALGAGEGLAGRAWSENRLVTLEDLLPARRPDSASAHRAANAEQAELNAGPRPAPAGPVASALACPVTSGGESLGALVLYSGTPQPADDDLNETLCTLSAALGHFLDRRRALENLRAHEQELEDFFRDAVMPIHWVDANGILLRANRAELDLLGYEEHEYVGRDIADFHVEQEVAAGILERLLRGEVVRDQEARLRARDGSIREVLIDSSGRWRDGRFVHSSCFTRDVTERRHAERTRRFLYQASRSLADLADYRTTLERVAQLAVPDFADWCIVHLRAEDGSIEQAAWVGRDPVRADQVYRLYRRYPPDANAEHGLPQVLRTGKPELLSAITEEMIRNAARSDEHLELMRSLQFSSSILVPLASKERGTFGALRFITAESGRRYSRDDLETALDLAARAAIAIENARLYESTRDADRRKDEFIATLAHELRNPLAPIRSGLDLLALDPARGPETIATMRRQVEHLVRLADDLLEVSRITIGRIELRLQPVELAPTLETAIEAARAAADGDRREVTVSVPAEPVWVQADPVRMLQVVGNLLSNAFKFTSEGGRIEVRLEREGEQAVVRVRDDGAGIAPELLPTIFDRFTQASRSLDRPQAGLGIGLSLVRDLVEMHRGAVAARSEGRGTGTEISVRLPLREAPPATAKTLTAAETLPAHALADRTTEPDARAERKAPGPPAPPATARRERGEEKPRDEAAAPSPAVLVVDDNVGAARMLALLLERLGASRVEIALDGTAALAKAEEMVPDLVLLDIGLPGMDGYQVAHELRQRPILRDVVLVALTGYGQARDRERSREAGFDEHLVKPASVGDLQRVLALGR